MMRRLQQPMTIIQDIPGLHYTEVRKMLVLLTIPGSKTQKAVPVQIPLPETAWVMN